jgi:hypothetical protein
MFAGMSILKAVRSGYVSVPRVARATLVNGHPIWQATCAIPAQVFDAKGLYGNVTAGSSSCKTIAVRKAVCEALERMAYVSIRSSSRRSDFGFGLCHDTTGMAAAPLSLFSASSPARRQALREALERWAIEQWWLRHLPAKPLSSIGSIHALTIDTPKAHGRDHASAVVITWMDAPSGRAYGFGAGPTVGTAWEHATTEMSRNHWALHALGSVETLRLTAQEKRLLYFSSKQGRQAFDERAQASFSRGATWPGRALPKLVVDEPIDGPWSKYAVVWRCLYEGTSWMSSKEPNAFAF